MSKEELPTYLADFKLGTNGNANKLKNCLTIRNAARAEFPAPSQFDLYTIPERFHQVVLNYLKVMNAIYKQQSLRQAFLDATELCQSLVRAAEYETNWINPVLRMCLNELKAMYQVSQKKNPEDLSLFEYQEVDEFGATPQKSSLLEQLANTYNKAFKMALNDKNPDTRLSKRTMVYYYMANLMRLYFKLGKSELARSLVKAARGVNLQLPGAQEQPDSVVTYLYYVALLDIDDGNYDGAAQHLELAVGLVSYLKNYEKSQQYKRIMFVLLPLKFMRGKRLAAKYWKNLPELVPIYRDGLFKAVNDGNLSLYEKLLTEYQVMLLRNHLYLVIERLRTNASLNLVKKTTAIIQEGVNESERHIVPLAPYKTAFTYASGSRSYSADQVECVLATLIAGGKMKGYISHVNQKMVLSKVKPFP
ncbi:cop9 signalosome complex subunit 12 [Diutina catenulata]